MTGIQIEIQIECAVLHLVAASEAVLADAACRLATITAVHAVHAIHAIALCVRDHLHVNIEHTVLVHQVYR